MMIRQTRDSKAKTKLKLNKRRDSLSILPEIKQEIET